tara:strand:+ start:16958 stop:17203 length:246 start_codon:yes stop_codon:yes gene_type:complete
MNWKDYIEEQVKKHNDKLVYCTLTEKEALVEFDEGYGIEQGKAFTAWGVDRVYFPVMYDGAEWVDSVPRDPCNEATMHVGG